MSKRQMEKRKEHFLVIQSQEIVYTSPSNTTVIAGTAKITFCELGVGLTLNFLWCIVHTMLGTRSNS